MDKVKKFKLTLDGDARQWGDLSAQFKNRFSTQGRSIRHLHEKWHSYSLNPSSDDIEMFIEDVKVTGNQ